MSAILTIIFTIIAPIFVIVGLAAFIGRRFTIDPRSLSRVVLYLFSPSLALTSLAHSDIQANEIGQILVMILLLYLAMTLISLGFARIFRFERKLEGAFMLSVVVINAGNYGLPLTEFAFGKAGLQRAILFYIITAVLANTLGIFLASKGNSSVRRSLLNIFTVPLPYATVLGLLINAGYLSLPVTMDRAISLLGQAAVPTMLVVLGLQLIRTSVRGRLGPILLATGTRLMIAPLIAFPLTALLGITGVTRQVVIIQASLPTAVISSILAAEFGSDVEFAATVILVSTLASIITVTILLWLLM
ncbi:MAG: AEC family transporter [Anaerolineae bacterium]